MTLSDTTHKAIEIFFTIVLTLGAAMMLSFAVIMLTELQLPASGLGADEFPRYTHHVCSTMVCCLVGFLCCYGVLPSLRHAIGYEL